MTGVARGPVRVGSMLALDDVVPVDRRLEPFGRQLVILAAERTLLEWLRLA